ncbi:MAG: sulfur carrier protein ThiS [Methylocystis sp.]
MRIRVNGLERDVAARTLNAVLEELGYEEQLIATALNQEFVRAKDRGETLLREGDALEIVAPKQGG